VTLDESWLYQCERRQSNNEFNGDIAATPTRPKNQECTNPLEKLWARIFFGNKENILLIDFLPKGQTINAQYYLSLLVQLKIILNNNAAERSRRLLVPS
jgi:hypothetical protein